MLELPMAPEAAATRSRLLTDPELRAELLRYVRARGVAGEAEDVVQATLAEAVGGGAPSDPEELRRWLFTVARNKAVDCYRRTRREAPLEPDEEAAAQSADPAARDLLRWAHRELPDGEQAPATLEWLLREGSGEKLEEIAAEAALPAPRVRQRVARLRKHFRERWAAQLGAAALLGAVALVAGLAYLKTRTPESPTPPIVRELQDPRLEREQRGRALRVEALRACDAGEFQRCLAELDAARELHPAGDGEATVQAARERARAALAPAPSPTPAPAEPEKAPAPDPESKPKPRVLRKAPAPVQQKNVAPLSKKAAPELDLELEQKNLKLKK